MKTVVVRLTGRSYKVLIGKGLISRLGSSVHGLAPGDAAFIVTNSFLKRAFGRPLEKSLAQAGYATKFMCVPDAESSKSFGQAARVISALTRFDKGRRTFIIALGGGVIGDLAGFVASVYRRGIAYVQVPTTLLAQVDSSIGGKTAVDLESGKNLAGTFYQPRLVLADVGLLRSLDSRQLRSGLAEVIKYGIIRDAGLFTYIERNPVRVLAGDPRALAYIVQRCAAIKASIVSQDEREEKGLRTILNFGHTIGHAVEAAGGFRRYNHGEAIALGMLVACGISRRLGLLAEKQFSRVESLIKRIGLPARIRGVRFEKIIKAHYHDKKFKGATNRFVLVSGIGKVVVCDGIALGVIKEALRERF
ncbi:MAG: 3-dehydroquinate synthase [Candidatus Omnitrophica bacterium]|nr:3-dehydroquinate synthase [Candidatus Omnitrophota bacterium]